MGPTSDGVVERLILQLTTRGDTGKLTQALNIYTGISAAVTGATVAIGAWALSAAEQQDQALKTARSLQLTTEEYTALAFAADRSGVSSEKLKTGLRGLQMQLEGASRGTGEGLHWFERMGISATDAEGRVRSAAEVLPELAQGISDLGTKGERSAAMMRTLGESGAEMATLLMGGADGINDLTERAFELGIVLDSGAALQSEALVDSWTDLKAAGSGLAIIFANRLIPTLIPLVDSMTELLLQSDGFARTTAHRAAALLARGFEFLDSRAGKAAAGVALVGSAIFAVRTGSGLVSAVSTALPMLGGLTGGLGAVAGPAALAGAALLAAGLIIDDLAVTARGGDSAILALADALGVADETQRAVAEGGSMLGEAWGAATTLASGLATVVGERLNAYLDFQAGLWGSLIPGMDGWIERLKTILSLSEMLTSVGDFFESSARGFSAFGEYMQGGDVEYLGAGAGDATGIGAMTGRNLVLGGIAGVGGMVRDNNLREQADRMSSPVVGYAMGGPAAPVSISPSVSVTVSDVDGIARASGQAVENQIRRDRDIVAALR